MTKQKFRLFAAIVTATCLILSGCSRVLPPKETPPPTPTEAPSPTPRPFTGEISTIEINQALSYGISPETGENYLMDSFVAKKSTTVFVRTSGDLEPDLSGERHYLSIYRNGLEIMKLPPFELSDSESLAFLISGSEAMELESGEYEFTVNIDGIQETRAAALRDTISLKILLIPIMAGAGDAVPLPENWQDYLWHLGASFPLSNDAVTVINGNQLDLRDKKYDLRTEEGMRNAWKALCDQAGTMGDFDMIFGFAGGSIGKSGNTDLFSFGRNAYVISTGVPCPEAAISHAAAHCFLAGDEYEGGAFNMDVNAPPQGFSGVSFYSPGEEIISEATGVTNCGAFGLICSSSAVLPQQIPFDSSRLKQFEYAASFMGNFSEFSSNYWISSAVWEHLYSAFAVFDFSAGAGSSGGIFEDGGESRLLCSYCHMDSPLEGLQVYYSCKNCRTMTPASDAEDGTFTCSRCGSANPTSDAQLYLACPYEHCGKFLRAGQSAGEEDRIGIGEDLFIAGEPTELSVDAVRIAGTLKNDGTFEAGQFYTERLSIDLCDFSDSGSHRIVMEASDGTPLFTYYFTPDFYANFEPAGESTETSVSFALWRPDGTARISLYGPKDGADSKYFSRDVSPGIPTGQFTNIGEGGTCSGTVTIQWNSEDSDADKLFFEVYFMDERGIIGCVYRGSNKEMVVDMSTLPQSEQAMFLLCVTDGVNSSRSLSPKFTAAGY